MFDWLSPGLYAVEAMDGWEDVTVSVQDEVPIVELLRKHGVKVSSVGRQYADGDVTMHVSNRRRAEKLIDWYYMQRRWR